MQEKNRSRVSFISSGEMFIELQANILAGLASILPDHMQLPYGIDIAKNKLGKTTKGYAVIVGSSKPTDAGVGRLTLFTTIDVTLSDSYGPTPKSDQVQLAASHTLSDRCLTVYKALASNKLFSDGVRNVTLVNISNPTYVADEHTVYRTITIEANLKG